MTWHRGRLACFDLETTGVDVETARIVTACVALVGGGRPTEVVRWLVAVDEPIPAAATAVHGVTTERARREGCGLREALIGILAALVEAPVVVAMNAPYDLTVLDRELRRVELPRVEICPVVDPLVLDRFVDPFRSGKRNLAALCAHYGVPHGGAHDAGSDALAAGRVVWRLMERAYRGANGDTVLACGYRELASRTVEQLHDAQVGWRREQDADLAHKFRQWGKPFEPQPHWPLVPYQEKP